ncbi:NIPSNAP family protein [Chelatococcus asaccharovorans]|uniref:NIPSNAP family protein n=1 Tax=Chelatococcus asaccharovorans TaxID=28210 RepID=UPI00224C7159|nr:NIPSNAP family protein [Chelatococcus asaccharovorans]CAH1659445.1 NIPSNAP protein [Chelatococcus asaccharovorans]CAH1687938.1 NIPSNAP protein [Chelatococcus asaccharovorans]
MAESDADLYELRIYAIAPGRLADMEARFRNDICKLFPRHGIRVIGCWGALAAPRMPTFVYLMRWSDLAERNAAFASFVADPDWHETRARTNGASELVEHYDIQFLRALDSSGIDEPMALQKEGVFELTLYAAANGRAAQMREALLEQEIPRRTRAGASTVAAFEAITGPRLPSVLSLLSWPDTETWQRAQTGIDLGPLAEAQSECGTGERYVLGHANRFLLRPVDVNWRFGG